MSVAVAACARPAADLDESDRPSPLDGFRGRIPCDAGPVIERRKFVADPLTNLVFDHEPSLVRPSVEHVAILGGAKLLRCFSCEAFSVLPSERHESLAHFVSVPRFVFLSQI